MELGDEDGGMEVRLVDERPSRGTGAVEDALSVYSVTVGTDTVSMDVMSVAVEMCVTAVSTVRVAVVL